MNTFTEADVEEAALDQLATVGWDVAHGPDIAPEIPWAERFALLPQLVSEEVGVRG